MTEYNDKTDKEILEGIIKLNGYIDEEEMQKPVMVLAPKLGSSEPGRNQQLYVYMHMVG